MNEAEIKKRVKAGAVLAQVSFEVLGSPRQHVEETIREFVANIEKDSEVHIISKEFGDPEEVEDGLFSTYADTELLVDKLDKFNWLCVNFMPATVEIIAPEELRFSDKDLTNWFNDLLAKLHEISTSYRQLSTKEEVFVKNMNAMIHNSILLACEHYHTEEEISKKLGVPAEQLRLFLDAAVKKNKLVKKGEQYHIKK